TENQKLATSLTNSNNQLKSFHMKIVKAKKAKQDYISKIQSVAQKSKKITKDQFKKATISLSAATECTKEIITFLIGKPPNYWISTGTLSRWNKEVAKISLQRQSNLTKKANEKLGEAATKDILKEFLKKK
ncbi:21834_t:CDS:2, partial [Dentiscutata erythropus]